MFANHNYAGDNNLSFIETSALDASNVELAFQNILTGMRLFILPTYDLQLYATNTFHKEHV